LPDPSTPKERDENRGKNRSELRSNLPVPEPVDDPSEELYQVLLRSAGSLGNRVSKKLRSGKPIARALYKLYINEWQLIENQYGEFYLSLKGLGSEEDFGRAQRVASIMTELSKDLTMLELQVEEPDDTHQGGESTEQRAELRVATDFVSVVRHRTERIVPFIETQSNEPNTAIEKLSLRIALDFFRSLISEQNVYANKSAVITLTPEARALLARLEHSQLIIDIGLFPSNDQRSSALSFFRKASELKQTVGVVAAAQTEDQRFVDRLYRKLPPQAKAFVRTIIYREGSVHSNQLASFEVHDALMLFSSDVNLDVVDTTELQDKAFFVNHAARDALLAANLEFKEAVRLLEVAATRLRSQIVDSDAQFYIITPDHLNEVVSFLNRIALEKEVAEQILRAA